MAKTATEVLQGFIADLRQAFAYHRDPRAQTEAIARHMEKILKVPGWLEQEIEAPAKAGYNRADLHLDPEFGHPAPGFLVMCSIQDPDRDPRLAGGMPHDHGASWVVYGVYSGAVEQVKYRWVYPQGQWTTPQLTEGERFIQRPGDVAFFLPGEIHKAVIATHERSLVLRVEGQRMELVARHRYDLATNSASLIPAAY